MDGVCLLEAIEKHIVNYIVELASISNLVDTNYE